MTVFKVKFPANGTSISSVDDMLDFMLGAEFAVAAGVDEGDIGKLVLVGSYKIDAGGLLHGVDGRMNRVDCLSEEMTTVVFEDVLTCQKVFTQNGIFHLGTNESVCEDLST